MQAKPCQRFFDAFFCRHNPRTHAVPPLRADYPSLIQSDSPKAYYRFNDSTQRTLINKNSGSLGAAGDATNDLATRGGACIIPGRDCWRPQSLPSSSISRPGRRFLLIRRLNPPNTQPFTVEAWLYPASDQTATGMSPLANRWTQGGQPARLGILSAQADASYNGSEPVGWACRDV